MTPQSRENGAAALSQDVAPVGVESRKLARELERAAVIAAMAFARKGEGTSPMAG